MDALATHGEGDDADDDGLQALPSWELVVKEITKIVRNRDGSRTAYLLLGNKTVDRKPVLATKKYEQCVDKCPQKCLDFYERRLRWQPDPTSHHSISTTVYGSVHRETAQLPSSATM